MYSMSETRLLVRGSAASIAGIQGRSHGQGIVLARREDLIAVRWPPSRLYHSEGSFNSYQPATTEVYRVLDIEEGPETAFRCLPVMEWRNGRAPEPLPLDTMGNPTNE